MKQRFLLVTGLIYGKQITVFFVEKLRREKNFLTVPHWLVSLKRLRAGAKNTEICYGK